MEREIKVNIPTLKGRVLKKSRQGKEYGKKDKNGIYVTK